MVATAIIILAGRAGRQGLQASVWSVGRIFPVSISLDLQCLSSPRRTLWGWVLVTPSLPDNKTQQDTRHEPFGSTDADSQ